MTDEPSVLEFKKNYSKNDKNGVTNIVKEEINGNLKRNRIDNIKNKDKDKNLNVTDNPSNNLNKKARTEEYN